ncbi:MAG: hypothetical protein WCK78_11305 [Paludibacter sp.]
MKENTNRREFVKTIASATAETKISPFKTDKKVTSDKLFLFVNMGEFIFKDITVRPLKNN